jgi:hypothetical protein
MLTENEKYMIRKKYGDDYDDIPAIIRGKNGIKYGFEAYTRIRQYNLKVSDIRDLLLRHFKNEIIKKGIVKEDPVFKITKDGLTYANEFSLFDIMKEVGNENKVYL